MASHVFSRLDVGVFKASRGDGVGLKDGEERVRRGWVVRSLKSLNVGSFTVH
jgi:hypothetical protein